MKINSLHEFSIIEHFFNRQSKNAIGVNLGIGDDCALLSPPLGELAISMDTLIAGVHFPEKTMPNDIGYKALAVNLSDLAAMGAQPLWVSLALTLPTIDENWLDGFSRGFFELIDRYSLQLVGGDLTKGPLSITVQVHGVLPVGSALKRSGAQVGDKILVTNTLGDAACALGFPNNLAAITKLNRPQPRIDEGLALRNIANSAIDISDGLLADLGHILNASQLGAKLDLTQIPLSQTLKKLPVQQALEFALTGGDDYELCFTTPSTKFESLSKAFELLPSFYTVIGDIVAEQGLHYTKEQSFVVTQRVGYQHF